ncbi:MAG: hypothetical protein Q8L77_10170, partial [Nitrospirota bacterium]|nr:hypothetical protein [Nitrospirota bacterium]
MKAPASYSMMRHSCTVHGRVWHSIASCVGFVALGLASLTVAGCGSGGDGGASTPVASVTTGGSLGSGTPTGTDAPRFAYVTNTDENTISMYAVNATSGQLRSLGYVISGRYP